MTQKEQRTATYDLIYLVGCAIAGTKADVKRVLCMNLPRVYYISKFHLLVAAAYEALPDEVIEAQHSKSVQKCLEGWREDTAKAQRKNLLLDIERAKLLAFLDREDIWYMVLKGAVIKDMYPKFGMRQMSDNDILFDENAHAKVRDYFVSQRYKIVSYNRSHHDVYDKKPIYSFEMHKAFFNKNGFFLDGGYYDNVKDRLVKDEGDNCAWHFTDEDFYIFMVVHAYKHFKGAGIGFKAALDMYVYLSHKGDALDMEYVKSECAKIGCDDFERELRELSLDMFANCGEPELWSMNEAKSEIFDRIMFAGRYGNVHNTVVNRINRAERMGDENARKKYLFIRLFPPRRYYDLVYPKTQGNAALIPFCWFHRLFRALLFKKRFALEELKMLGKLNREEENK